MTHIIAIGGGDIAKGQTTAIDTYILSLSKKKHPRVLFIPTASEDSEEYCANFTAHYADLGSKVDVLELYRNRPSQKEMQRIIKDADVIYVGGGNTLRMMKLWRKLGVDKLLKDAWENGTIMCGLSAGAICWFREGNSDSKKYSSGSAKLIKVRGLDLYDCLLCPHYDVERNRRPSLKNMMRTTPGFAIALDNCAALHIRDDQFKVITSKKSAHAYRVHKTEGKVKEEKLS